MNYQNNSNEKKYYYIFYIKIKTEMDERGTLFVR